LEAETGVFSSHMTDFGHFISAFCVFHIWIWFSTFDQQNYLFNFLTSSVIFCAIEWLGHECNSEERKVRLLAGWCSWESRKKLIFQMCQDENRILGHGLLKTLLKLLELLPDEIYAVHHYSTPDTNRILLSFW
jgi:hypothetical protein